MRRSLRFILLAAVMPLAACDLPTEAPIVEGQWLVPVQADSIAVSELLPSDVSIADGSFVFSVPAASGQQTLGDLCGCPAGVAPKPAFVGDVTTTLTLPSTVASATLASTDVRFTLTHNLGFDPIRPSSNARGTVTLTIRSAGQTLATRVIDGVDTPLPSGVAREEIVSLPAGSVVTGTVEVQLTVDSPAGDAVLIDPARSFSVAGAPENVRASSASVRIVDEVVAPTSSTADIGSVGTDVREKIQSATLDLQLANPFAVAGSFVLRFQSTGTDVIPARNVSIAGGNETISVNLAKPEIDALFAAGDLSLELSGSVSGTGTNQLVTVLPTQVVRVTPRLRLATRIGE